MLIILPERVNRQKLLMPAPENTTGKSISYLDTTNSVSRNNKGDCYDTF